jgi:hypothetical protein
MKDFIITVIVMLCAIIVIETIRDNGNQSRLNDVLKAQLELSNQQIADLQHINSQMAAGNIDGYGNPIQKVNLDTLKYASFCEGYNQAVEHIGKNYKGDNGYVLGFHAATNQEKRMIEYSKEEIEWELWNLLIEDLFIDKTTVLRLD